MKVLITGGSGFLGSYLVEHLKKMSIDVVIYDLDPSSTHEELRYHGDILDISNLKRSMKGCDCVYHFAANMDMDYCLKHPRKSISCNILGTVNVLSCCIDLKIDRLLFASSVYASSKLGGIYGTTKLACEKIIEDYHKYYGLNYVCLRYGSLYGPGADRNNRIRKYLEEALKFRKIKHLGDGSETREFIYVNDAAAISVDALNKYSNQSIIITGSQSIVCSHLFTMIEEILGHKLQVEYETESDAPHYSVTPVTFDDLRLVKKVTQTESIDMGQGILECLKWITRNG